jgi:hypothetical protein
LLHDDDAADFREVVGFRRGAPEIEAAEVATASVRLSAANWFSTLLVAGTVEDEVDEQFLR